MKKTIYLDREQWIATAQVTILLIYHKVAETCGATCAAHCNCKDKLLYDISLGLDYIEVDIDSVG